MARPKMTMAFALAVALHFLLSATPAFAQAKASLRIAAFVPLSGALAPYGQRMLQSMNLALADLATTDADLAKRITLISKDTQKYNLEIERLANEAVTSDKADLFIGALTSSSTYMLASAAESLRKPLIAPIVTTNSLTTKGQMIFRAVYRDSDQGDVLAQYALKHMNKTAAAIILPSNSEAAGAFAQQFEKSFTAGGGSVVAKIDYTPGSGGVRKLLDKVHAARPQVIIYPGFYQDVGKIMDEATNMGLRYSILGGDGLDSPQLFKLTSKNGVRGHFFVTPFALDDPDASTVRFISAFKQKYQQDPDMLAALSYDAMLLAIHAFKRANSRLPDSLARALANSKDVPGVLGPLSINANRDAMRPAVIIKTHADGGKFATKITPAPTL